MMKTPVERHRRYSTQAVWTGQVRSHLLERLGHEPLRTLDVGCGTGAVTGSLPGRVFGIDISLEDVRFAASESKGPAYLAGDAYQLPFDDNRFELACCHFLLLWLQRPAEALREMIRVLKPGGSLVVFAEPDYGGRIDYPPPLEELAALQADALRRQGSDPEIGRKLRGALHDLGLSNVTSGVLGGEWNGKGAVPPDIASEWEIFSEDLRESISSGLLEHYLEIDRSAWLAGSRILYVPTFYASGRKPG